MPTFVVLGKSLTLCQHFLIYGLMKSYCCNLWFSSGSDQLALECYIPWMCQNFQSEVECWSTEGYSNILKNIGEHDPLCGYVSYIISPEEKFHKEETYEAVVGAVIHSLTFVIKHDPKAEKCYSGKAPFLPWLPCSPHGHFSYLLDYLRMPMPLMYTL